MSEDEPSRTQTWHRHKNSQNTDCLISETCGTCEFINQSYEDSLQKKYLRSLQFVKDTGVLDDATVLPPNPSPKKLGYRTHAKLAVREQEGKTTIGLFKRKTHTVVDMEECPLHKKEMNRLISDLKEFLAEEPSLTPYNEEKHSGVLRYLSIRANHQTNALMLTFVVMEPKVKNDLKSLIAKLKTRGHKINSAYMNIHTEKSNAIFSDDAVLLTGARRLRESLCDLSFEISPTAFFQVNPWTAQLLYRRIEQIAQSHKDDDIAWDLYCGVGQIAMLLARSGYRTLGIEMNPQATRDAQNNAANNELQNQLHFIAGSMEQVKGDFPDWAWPPALIVANPPRKGIGEEIIPFILRGMNKNPNCKFIYMSCEAESMAEDLKHFANAGYKVRQIEAYDMFPFTDKMEWLAVVTK